MKGLFFSKTFVIISNRIAVMEIIKENFARTKDCPVFLVLDGRKASDNTLL